MSSIALAPAFSPTSFDSLAVRETPRVERVMRAQLDIDLSGERRSQDQAAEDGNATKVTLGGPARHGIHCYCGSCQVAALEALGGAQTVAGAAAYTNRLKNRERLLQEEQERAHEAARQQRAAADAGQHAVDPKAQATASIGKTATSWPGAAVHSAAEPLSTHPSDHHGNPEDGIRQAASLAPTAAPAPAASPVHTASVAATKK